MNTHLLSFTSSNWTQSRKRLQSQLTYIQKKYNFFKTTNLSTEKDLGESWNNRYGKYFNERGFALWSWKPYLIYNALKNIENGDCLMYIDGGCSFPLNNWENFQANVNTHLNNLQKCDLKIGVEPELYHKFKNSIIIRRQILEFMNLQNDQFFLNQWLHYEAGILLIIKDDETMKFIKQWMDFFENHFEGVIYSKFNDRYGQRIDYAHNGSDQAVLQCLLYKNNNRFYSILDNIWYKYGIYSRITEY